MRKRLAFGIGIAVIIIAGGCLALLFSNPQARTNPQASDASQEQGTNSQDVRASGEQTGANPAQRETSDSQNEGEGEAVQNSEEGVDDGDVLSDEEFAEALDAVEAAEPSGSVVGDADDADDADDASGIVAELQGWWHPADGSQGIVVVFEGNHYRIINGNGLDRQEEGDLHESDVAHASDGWTLSMGSSSLFVMEADNENPVLTTPESTVTLVRGEGSLY